MTELHRHIGPNTDVPAGDIGVGGREIGFMFGQYKRICNEFTGVLTGKGPAWGGSCMRPEATGYGVAYFCTEMLKTRGDSLSGKRVVVSGSGNVAQFAVKKCISLGATVLTMSDSSGYIFDPSGITTEKLQWIMELKNVRRGRISEYADHFGDEGSGVEFIPEKRAWSAASKTQVGVALPCATQNEIDESDAHLLVTEGCRCVCEGANMPSTSEAIRVFRSNSSHVLYSPGKASNAGGVATSALEMAQNSQRVSWSCDEVDRRLCEIMTAIHENCHSHGRRPDGSVDYVHGANTAAFVKVADAMLEQGFV
ncbi:gdhA [Symbiodinium microadriaticum]|nr:gdhA [Symbiodinium microadriaticum]